MREDPRSCRKCTTTLQVTGKHGTTLVQYFWTLSGLLLVGCWLLRFGLGQTNRTLSNTTERHAAVGNSHKGCFFPTLRPCVFNCTVILHLRMSQMASLWCLHVNQWLSLLSLASEFSNLTHSAASFFCFWPPRSSPAFASCASCWAWDLGKKSESVSVSKWWCFYFVGTRLEVCCFTSASSKNILLLQWRHRFKCQVVIFLCLCTDSYVFRMWLLYAFVALKTV